MLIGSLTLLACDAGSSSAHDAPGVKSTDDSWVRSETRTPVEIHGALSVNGAELVDQNGDAVQLKGVSSMWLNWETDGYAENPDALLWMRDHWNLSLIRAAMGIDVAGAYIADPDKAKQQVRTIVDNAIAAGVYVIIDWHDHHAPSHVEQSVEFFTEMATAYAGVPNVIYETFNEPVGLDWTSDIKPYHERVVTAIRAVEPNAVVVLGTPTYSQDVDVAANSPLDGSNLMYALHFYACTHGSYLMSKLQTARAMGLPIFVTEWGATHADGGIDGKVCLTEAAQWMDLLAPFRISWAAWKLDNCTPDSTCLVASGAPVNGGWSSAMLHGHAPFVRDAMRE
ncbi:MAG: glycoside hydrolase family 5 protein [Polyangiaceae bacterium]